MFGFIVGILIGVFLGRLIVKNDYESRLAKRNIQWAQFIVSYKKIVSSAVQLSLIKKMTKDIIDQGLVDENEAKELVFKLETTKQNSIDQISENSDIVEQEAVVNNIAPSVALQDNTNEPLLEQKKQIDIDLSNASLLLYFGAFLFVASVGLFVAFSDVGGLLKVLAVFIVSILLYVVGCYLYFNKTNYSQVGVAFAGIGMTIMPLIGLAVYKYVFFESYGAEAWFIGSVLSLAMYVHAVWYFRQTFLNYVLIFTALSMFESATLVIDAPLYYFGWVMAFLALLLLAISYIKPVWPDFKESAIVSSQILLPLTILVSLYMVVSEGTLQLGISLLIGAIYYGLLSLNKINQNNKILYTTVSHVLAISSVMFVAYGLSNSLVVTSIVAIVINILQVLAGLLLKINNYYFKTYYIIVAASLLIGFLLAFSGSLILYIATFVFIVGLYAMWLKNKNTLLYIFSSLTIVVSPILVMVLGNGINYSLAEIAYVGLFTLLLQALLYFIFCSASVDKQFNNIASATLIASSGLVALLGLAAQGFMSLFIIYVIAVTYILFAKFSLDKRWYIGASAITALPILVTFYNTDLFSFSVIIALLCQIMAALVYRNSVNRIIGSIIWFIVPLSLAYGLLESYFNSYWFVVSYIVVMVGYIFARAIARGVVKSSFTVPLSSYENIASISYVVGYIGSAAVALAVALVQLEVIYSSLVLVVLIGTNICLSLYIEKNKDYLALLPLFAQALLINIIRPDLQVDNELISASVLITATALLSYGIISLFDHSKLWVKNTLMATVITFYFAPALLFSGNSIWVLPVCLMVALLVTYLSFKPKLQFNKEIYGFLGLVAIYWLLLELNISNVQVYSHILVALFVFYAFVRNKLKQIQQSDAYIYCALATATIPLIVQSLLGESGDLYGWWLLLEQVFIMLLGIFIHKSILIRWGLYVAVASVLWQLRGLGWVSLSLLALFIISIAIYQIYASNKKQS